MNTKWKDWNENSKSENKIVTKKMIDSIRNWSLMKQINGGDKKKVLLQITWKCENNKIIL
jgi:hypothetical protein